MKRHSILILAVLTLISACSMKEQTDLILTNATVYTVNDNFQVAQALAVKDGKIEAVGSSEQITGQYQAGRVIDLEGKPVYPGFIDPHCHF